MDDGCGKDGRPELEIRCQMSDVRCKIKKGLEDKSAGIPFRAMESGGNKQCENIKRWVLGVGAKRVVSQRISELKRGSQRAAYIYESENSYVPLSLSKGFDLD